MPPRPPSWSQGRKYGIVIDAGSSGSRVQVYSWIDPEIAKQQKKSKGKSVDVLSKIEKGVEEGDGWHMKVEPGVSFFGDNPDAVSEYLRPLIDFASAVVPSSQISSTPIYLLATAGMRLLPDEQRDAVLANACSFLQTYNFLLSECSNHVRVITGEEEGLYGWIAVNYLMDGFDKHEHTPTGEHRKHSSTYGFLDMGGASTQIAFEPSEVEQVKHADNLQEITLRLLSGKDVHHPVFVTTWLGFGTNQARDRYVDQEIKTYLRVSDADDAASPSSIDSESLGSERPVIVVDDPCLPKDLMLSEPRYSGYTLKGTGDFASCVRRTGPLLNKEVECLDQPCLFNGVHVPPIDFSVNHFIGISEYWYSTQDVWSMGGMYDFVEFEKNAIDFCGRPWKEIMADHKQGSKWRSDVELSRLETQCFKAAWIINILHEGIGIPRIIDKDGKGDGKDHAAQGVEKAAEKGLLARPPSFQSLNQVGDVAVSWTLGKMVLEVSKGAGSPGATGVVGQVSETSLGGGLWKPSSWAGHIPSWNGDVKSSLSGVVNSDPLPILGFVGAVLTFWYFCFSSTNARRRKNVLGSIFGHGTRRRERNASSVTEADVALLAEEAGGISDGSSDGRPPPRGGRRGSTFLSSVFSPVRYNLLRISSVLRSWTGRSPKNNRYSGGLLPMSRATLHVPSMNGGTNSNPSGSNNNEQPFRPRPIRQANSTPFMRVNPLTAGGIMHGNPSGAAHYLDAPDVSDREKRDGVPSILTRSQSSHVLSSMRSTSPPPIASAISSTPLSRPTTPSSRPGTVLTKLSRARDSSTDEARKYSSLGQHPNNVSSNSSSSSNNLINGSTISNSNSTSGLHSSMEALLPATFTVPISTTWESLAMSDGLEVSSPSSIAGYGSKLRGMGGGGVGGVGSSGNGSGLRSASNSQVNLAQGYFGRRTGAGSASLSTHNGNTIGGMASAGSSGLSLGARKDEEE